MARGGRVIIKKVSIPQLTLLELLQNWTKMFVYGVLPTAIPHLFVTLFYVLTMDNPDLGNIVPLFLRASPSLYLFYRLYKLGREDSYRLWVAAGLVVSMVGDLFFMKKDETSFLMAMGCYSVMHLMFTFALGFEYFGAVGLGSSAVIAMMWTLILLPQLTDYFFWIAPLYICLVCLTFWRGGAQPDLENYGTKSCGVMGTLFFLIAHFNFSLNAFTVLPAYDYLNIMTIVLFSVGQMLIAISTFDERVVFDLKPRKKK